MPEAEFFDTTPVHFMRRRKSFLQNRNGMEEARFISFFVMKAAGAKIRRLTQIAKFPWDIVVETKWLPWDDPSIQEFSEAADRALAVLNPEAYARYMEGKAPPNPPDGGENVAPDDLKIEAELDF